VLINAPGEGSEYYKYCIYYFEVGKNGSESDGRVFQNCSLLELPENGLLPTGSFLVGDDAFPLKSYMMNAYKNYNRPLTEEESIFSYRSSRARRIIENVFGVLLRRFRFLDRKLAVKLGTVNKIVSAACALHNWLVITSEATSLSAGAIEENNETCEIIPGRWRSEIRVLRDMEKYGGNRTTKLAKKMRGRLKAYFNHEDAFSWQYKATFGTSRD
jgi:hypothetical protein